MGTISLEAAFDPDRRTGAVMMHRDGCDVVAHYGSAAAEIAVCMKAAGLVERSSMRLLAISGSPALLDRVLGAASPEGAPAPGRAVCVAGTWCCRTAPERALVAGPPGAVGRWRQVESRAISTAGLAVSAELLPGASALSVVGPRAALVVATAGLAAELPVEAVATSSLGGSPVTVVREDADRFLLLFERGVSPAVWEGLAAAGRPVGLAPVGNEALERLRAARRPLVAVD